MTTGESAGYGPADHVPTGPLHSREELEWFRPPATAGLTGYETTGPLFTKEELERHKPPRTRRKLDWGTAATVGTSCGIALAIVAAGVAWGAAEGYSPGRIVREIVHGSPRVRTVTRARKGTAAAPAPTPSPVLSFVAGRPVVRQVTVTPRPVTTVNPPLRSARTAAHPAQQKKAEPPAVPTTPAAPVPTTAPPPVPAAPPPSPTTAPPPPLPTASVSLTAAPKVSTSP